MAATEAGIPIGFPFSLFSVSSFNQKSAIVRLSSRRSLKSKMGRWLTATIFGSVSPGSVSVGCRSKRQKPDPMPGRPHHPRSGRLRRIPARPHLRGNPVPQFGSKSVLALMQSMVKSIRMPDRMPRKRCNLPVKVRSGELSVHPGSEDPVLRGDPQD